MYELCEQARDINVHAQATFFCATGEAKQGLLLTQLFLDKMTAISQTIFSDAFS